ncbi:MAG TPA: hypothetical protein VF796_10905 [Humisphaera sp.]
MQQTTTTAARKWVLKVLAAAAVTAAPAFSPLVGPARADSYDEIVTQLNDTERQLRDEDARFAQETAGMNRGSRTYREASRRHDDNIKEIRDRRAKLKVQAERAKTSTVAKAGDRLENTGDKIEAEKRRHAEAMKKLPAGSAAAQDENQRHEDRLRELRTRRDDVKEDVANARQVAAAGKDYKRDKKSLESAIKAENERHAKALRYLPANSPQAVEEDNFHAQRLREINDGVEAAADRRDMTVGNVQANKAVDDGLDNVNKQIADEQARHGRRMAQVSNGSAAHAEEERQYQQTMGQLQARKAQLQNQAAGAQAANQQQYALKRQLDQIDEQLAQENTRFNRRLNDVKAGSEIERLERQQHNQTVADLSARRAQVVAQLNGGAGAAQASGR